MTLFLGRYLGVWMLENAGFWNAVYELVFVT